MPPPEPIALGNLSRDVVLFSTADWDHPFWTNKQRVAVQLAERGFRVLYVESLGLRRPSAGARDLRRMGRRLRRAVRPLRQVRENIWVCSPLVVPWHGHASVRRFNERWLGMQIERQMSRLGFARPILWTYNPLLEPLLARLSRSLLVYHCVDDLSAAPHVPAEAIRQAESALTKSADVVFTTSPALQERLQPLRPEATIYLPNVADYDHFAQARQAGPIPEDLAVIPRPRIGFIGAISSYKVDFDLIAEVAGRRPDCHWVLIGQVGEGQPDARVDALALPNIHFLGPRDYGLLPNYLRGFDAATIPARANPYTEAMFPMKFFEYLAAGCPVIAAQVPAIEQFAAACRLVNSPEQFVAALVDVLAGRVPDPVQADALARRFTWQWRMNEMLEALQKAMGRQG